MVSISGAVPLLVIGNGVPVVKKYALGIERCTDGTTFHEPLLDDSPPRGVHLLQEVGALHAVVGVIPLVLGIAL